MKMKMLARSGLLVATSVASVAGFTGLASADASINNTGPWSNNSINAYVASHFRVTNNNNVRLTNSNHQTAATGGAFVGGNTGVKHFRNNKLFSGCEKRQVSVWQSWGNKKNDCVRHMLAWRGGNTFGGNASTGNASNWNQTNVGVALTNNTWTPSWGGGGSGGSASIWNTGPGSNNTIRANVRQDTTVRNNNNVSLTNRNNQVATTGNASVSGNTFGGSASTGNASNANSTDAWVSVDNNTPLPTASGSSMGGSASIGTTGPNSNNVISGHFSSNTSVTNNNNVSVTNSNNQVARSGNANVSGNTSGGSASTGDASNWNSTNLMVAISNQ